MKFLLGEVRQVGIEVISTVNQSFVIAAADYSIENRESFDVISAGTATIEDYKILTLFAAASVGKFQVVFTYRIAAEILKAVVYIDVA